MLHRSLQEDHAAQTLSGGPLSTEACKKTTHLGGRAKVLRASRAAAGAAMRKLQMQLAQGWDVGRPAWARPLTQLTPVCSKLVLTLWAGGSGALQAPSSGREVLLRYGVKR